MYVPLTGDRRQRAAAKRLTVGVVKDPWPIRYELETDMLRPRPEPVSSIAVRDGWRWQDKEEEEEEEGDEE